MEKKEENSQKSIAEMLAFIYMAQDWRLVCVPSSTKFQKCCWTIFPKISSVILFGELEKIDRRNFLKNGEKAAAFPKFQKIFSQIMHSTIQKILSGATNLFSAPHIIVSPAAQKPYKIRNINFIEIIQYLYINFCGNVFFECVFF